MDIVVSKVCKSYGGQNVLCDASFRFVRGKTTCIMGPSGCGKTTLLRLMLGLEKPDSGTIEGIPRGCIGTVFQEERLCMNLSAVANLKLVCKKGTKEETIYQEMEALGLSEAAGKPVRELSGGMKQRVAILRALLCDSSCIVMDEPLKALDEDNKRNTAAYIRRAAAGKTLIVVTHDPEDIDLLEADYRIQMEP